MCWEGWEGGKGQGSWHCNVMPGFYGGSDMSKILLDVFMFEYILSKYYRGIQTIDVLCS